MKSFSDLVKPVVKGWFPLRREELGKFFCLGIVYFLVCMNYTILRNLKDTLVITYPTLGAELIPFLRTWLLFPVTFIFTWSYVRLSRLFSVRTIFLVYLAFFTLFFVFFIFYLYPHRSQLVLPAFLPPLVQHWSFSLFYVLSEVWGAMVISLLFWGYVNQHTPLELAKRFYAPFLICANISGIAASEVSLWLGNSSLKFLLFPGHDHWGASLCLTVLWVVLASIVAAFFFFSLKENIVYAERKKEKFSMSKSFSYLLQEKKLWPYAAMVFCYFFSTGILELLWKSDLRILYPNPNDFNNVLNNATFWISLASTIIALTISGALVRRLPLLIVAALTPVILLLPMILWFAFSIHPSASFATLPTLMGALYFCLNRITKFTFFDLSKELACVPLTIGEQTQAKAVLDGILPKFGKLTESVYLQALFLLGGSFQSSYLLILFSLIILHFGWISAIFVPTQANRGIDEKAH